MYLEQKWKVFFTALTFFLLYLTPRPTGHMEGVIIEANTFHGHISPPYLWSNFMFFQDLILNYDIPGYVVIMPSLTFPPCVDTCIVNICLIDFLLQWRHSTENDISEYDRLQQWLVFSLANDQIMNGHEWLLLHISI